MSTIAGNPTPLEAILDHPSSAIAVRDDDAVATYGDLVDAAEALAGVLARRATAGDRVVIAVPTGLAHVVSYLAVQWLGCVAVSVSPDSTDAELARVGAVADPTVVIRPQSRPRTRSSAPEPAPMIVTVDAHGAPEDASASRAARVEVDRDADASLLFTSGSTGLPKAVRLTHANVAWAASAASSTTPLESAGTTALCLPLHHAYAQNAVMAATLVSGATLAVSSASLGRAWIGRLARDGVTSLQLVPPLLRLAVSLGASRSTMPTLVHALSAAAPLPAAVQLEWTERFGFPVHNGYGLTETSPCAMYSDPARGDLGALGRPLPGVEVRIAGADGVDVDAHDADGRLLVRSPGVMRGYVGRAEASPIDANGWLDTGDVARRRPDGSFSLVGRRSTRLRVSGEDVFPGEIEQLLLGHPDVLDAAVVGRPHRSHGEIPVAFVELRPEATSSTIVDDLLAHCRRSLAPIRWPRRLEVVEALPRLPGGKVDRVALSRQ